VYLKTKDSIRSVGTFNRLYSARSLCPGASQIFLLYPNCPDWSLGLPCLLVSGY